MVETYSDVVQTARDYYNSEDADNFYTHIWGGEDIHIGVYTAPNEDIATASRRTVETIADQLGSVSADSRLLDIGSGYGGAARYLAKKFGCTVTALNLSETENEKNRALSEEAGLSDQISVVDGSFEEIPAEDKSFDVVWSQDAILHSGWRDRVVSEVARVLKPGGQFIFTDIMQADDVDPKNLQAVYDRIHLSNLGSLAFYKKCASLNGLNEIGFDDHTPQLVTHYTRVHEELSAQRNTLKGKVSDGYIDRMLVGLNAWVEAGKAGDLVWGILHFKKAD